jgi:hypothetical protein
LVGAIDVLGLELVGLPGLFLWVAVAGCEPRPLPAVEVTSSEGAIDIDNSRSLRELTQISLNAYGPDARLAHTPGMTRGVFKLDANFVIRADGPATGPICYSLHTIKVDVQYRATIYIANEHPPNSCQYRELLAHEMKHVAVDREVIRDSKAAVSDHVLRTTERIASLASLPLDTEASVRQAYNGILAQALTEALERIQRDRNRRQKTLDTPEEYQRIAAACTR